MARDHAAMSQLAHSLEFLGRPGEAIFHRARKLVYRSGGNQPSRLAVANELRDPGNEGCKHRPTQRHGLHNHDRQTFGKAGLHQRTCSENLIAHRGAADPASHPDAILERVFFDELLELSAYRPISGEYQLEPHSLAGQTSSCLDKQQLPFFRNQTPDTDEARRNGGKMWGTVVKRFLQTAVDNFYLRPVRVPAPQVQLTASKGAD